MQKKKKVLIVFGGKSGEHEVSLESAASVFKALNRENFEVYLMGVTKEGHSLLVDEKRLTLGHSKEARVLKLGQNFGDHSMMQNNSKFIMEDGSLRELKVDVVFPLIHGTTGEDGVLQGYLEFMDIPYVGSSVLASSLCMDKDMCKRVLQNAGIPVVPYLRFFSHDAADLKKMREEVEAKLGYPCFVKPANMGSSVGIHKIKCAQDFNDAVTDAFRYDSKILIEKGLRVKEYEVAILGNEKPQASCVGEIVPTHEFYSYEAKYLDQKGADLKIPAEMPAALSARVQKLAVEVFKVLECSGLARIDFFLDQDSEEIFLNEVNTLPGFTAISMYPKLWEASGLSYAKLLDQLIELALERHDKKKSLKTSFV